MRNYIILNDQNSNDISGLLIQSLAPISKPLMRTEIEEIDGRDGDITTKLGYSAYDKQITIGLFGNYDVDQVIAFFNSEGTAIFSNEPDKYYNYQIVDQIDFERLVRYKTATVTMHCQPFKYSTTEGADILSSSDNFATLNQSLNTDSGFYTYSSNVQADVTATRQSGTGGKFFAVFTVPVVQGVNYHFSGNVSRDVSMYGYTDQLRGTSAGIAGKGFSGNFVYTATFTGTMVLGFYSNATTEIFIRNFAISNEAGSTVSDEGTNLVLEDSAEAPFSQFDLKGNTEQQTYSGKNLFDYATGFKTSVSGLTNVLNDDGTITISGKPTANYVLISTFKDLTDTLVDGATYTLSSSLHNANFIAQIRRKRGDGTYAYLDTISGNKTFTVDKTTYVKYEINIMTTTMTNWGDATATYTSNFQLESGSSATSFEPYVGGTASPNPDYPQDVRVVAGNNTVKICGKNLIGGSLAQLKSWNTAGTWSGNSYTRAGIVYTPVYENGLLQKVIANGTSTASPSDFFLYRAPLSEFLASFKQGVQYTMSAFTKQHGYNGSGYIRAATANPWSNVLTNNLKVNSTTGTIDLRGTSYSNVYVHLGIDRGVVVNNLELYPQLVEGSTLGEYEPHQEQRYEINFTPIELCKLGDYQDYIYKSGSKWYKHKTTDKIAFSDMGFYAGQIGTTGHYRMWSAALQGLIPTIPDNDTLGNFMSNVYTAVSANTTYSRNIGISQNTNSFIIIYDPDYDTNSATDFITNMTALGAVLRYALATPVEEEITNSALIEQLNDIADHAHAYRGRTHISSTYASGNVPHIIAATVTGDPSGTVTNSGNIYSKPKLTIFGSGDIGVYLNGVQMFQIALGDSGYITIDTALMEAYQDNLETLMNRQVTGDYSNFKLPVGESTISFSGSVSMCVVENYSRWL